MSGTPLFSEVNIPSRPSKLTTVSARLLKKMKQHLARLNVWKYYQFNKIILSQRKTLLFSQRNLTSNQNLILVKHYLEQTAVLKQLLRLMKREQLMKTDQ